MSIIERAPVSDQLPDEWQRDYEFVLPEYTLNDPEQSRGHVVSLQEQPAVDEHGRELPEGVRVFEVGVQDAYVNADPATYQAVNHYISRIEQMSCAKGLDYMQRTEAVSEEERNQFTQAWLSDPKVSSLSVWRNLVPTAEALHYLTNPNVGEPIHDRQGNTDVISMETAAQLRFVEDAVAIRDRGIAMAHLLTDYFMASGTKQEDVLSLASGTAEPVLAAAKEASEATGKNVTLTVADYDRESLAFVRANAERFGLGDVVTGVTANILSDTLSDRLEKKTGLKQWDVVENMGFEEYLPQEGDEMGAFKGAGLPQASEFTRNAFELVKPGGVMISGNMVLDRPQRDFVFGIVDWPLINARSEQSILRVYKEAGLLDDPNVQIDMFRVVNAQTGTHVYNIVRATKLQ